MHAECSWATLDDVKIRSWFVSLLLLLAMIASGCSLIGSDSDVVGFPDIDFGVDAHVYLETPQRALHLHLFFPDGHEPTQAAEQDSLAPAVLFFHGGGFANTRVEQFEHQARALAERGMVGVIVEYRVTSEGTTRANAVSDGRRALEQIRASAGDFGIDPARVAMAGASAGGALAVEASAGADALVLFNPAVNAGVGGFAGTAPTIVFHSREDTIVAFESAEGFCDAAIDCELVAFDEGDHGFFNEEPALTETVDGMLDFLDRRL